jgi:amidophosphoribosyltransferase
MCGIQGIVADDYSDGLIEILAWLGYGNQHRGKENAGIGSTNGDKVHVVKGSGYAQDVLAQYKEKIVEKKPVKLIQHIRYSTTGNSGLVDAQPIWEEFLGRRIALISNGTISNFRKLRSKLQQANPSIKFRTNNDAEFALYYIMHFADYNEENIPVGIQKFLENVNCGYNAAILTESRIFLFRDPSGFRPLSVGKKDGCFLFSSENGALKQLGAGEIESIEPGVVYEIESPSNVTPHRKETICGQPCYNCIFEKIYFGRPDSELFEEVKETAHFRRSLGRKLALEYPVPDVDFVTTVPFSGLFAGEGYSDVSGLRHRWVMIPNPYVGRTFIEPNQKERAIKALLKHSPLKDTIQTYGSTFVLVEDSIVRGTTLQVLVAGLKKAGATEIHVRVSSPPVISQCHYGMDFPTKKELIANKRNKEQIRRFLAVASLEYLEKPNMDEVVEATGSDPRKHCDACFTGKYPIPLN